MNLKIPNASGEEDRKKFNPFLPIEEKTKTKPNPQHSFQDSFRKGNQFGNPFNKNVFQATQVKFQQNATNNLVEKSQNKANQNIFEANKLQNNFFIKNFEELNKQNFKEHCEKLKNAPSPNLNSIKKESNFNGEYNLISTLNDYSKPFAEGKSGENKENCSLDANANDDAVANFSKNCIDFSNCEQGNYFNISKKKANNKSALDLNNLKFTKNKNEDTTKSVFAENQFSPQNRDNPAFSQLHISQLNIGQKNANSNCFKSPKANEEENGKQELKSKGTIANYNPKISEKHNFILCDPFAKSSLNNIKKITDNDLNNKNESKTELNYYGNQNNYISNDLINKEIRNISKKVINFKIKEESSNENFKNDENTDANIIHAAVNNFANITKKNPENKISFQNPNQIKKATNNNKLFSDLLAVNRNKNTKNLTKELDEAEAKDQENFNSRLGSKDYSTKDNSIATYLDKSYSNSNVKNFNEEKTDLKVTGEISYDNAVSDDNKTPKAKNYGLDYKDCNTKLKNNDAQQNEETLYLNANQNENANLNFQPAKILKIKDAKAINLPTEAKKQQSAININLLKKKKVTINPASSVKKYAEQSEDYYLDLEIHKRNCTDASKYFTELELNNLNPMEKNKLAGKLKLNTDKRQYCGRFNQLNGEKIESYRVYRDDDLNIPAELQSKIHIKPENERFEEDMSSSDEIIQIAKIHYNAQFNLLKMKNFNFFMCNNLKYTQGLYWDD